MTSANVQLSPGQTELILRLIEKHLGSRAYRIFVFGSRAKGNARPNSDLDLMIDAETELGPAKGALVEEFEQSDLPFKIDLVEKISLSNSFLKNVQDELVELASHKITYT